MLNKLCLVSILFFIFKIQVNAQSVSWVKTGSSPGFENGNAIVTDDTGNVYVTGQIEYTSVFGNISLPTAGQHDIFVAKYDPNGVLIWIRSAGGNEGDIGSGIGIDSKHNVYITGEIETTVNFGSGINLTSSGGNDIFVAKYDANGNIVWARKFGHATSSDKGRAIAVSPSGNCYVTGNFGNSFSFGSTTRSSNGGNDVFIVKYDTNGNPVWAKSGGGSKQDRGFGIALDAAENVYVTGSFTTPATFHGITLTGGGKMSAFVVKYSSSGSYQWAKSAGDGSDTTQANAITLDPSGNIYIAGQFNVKTKFSSTSLTSSGSTDMFIAKYSNSGSVIWAKKAGGAGEDIANGITCDAAVSRIYITGFVASAGSAGSISYPFSGYKDVFVGSFSSNSGSEKWVRTYGGHWRDVGLAITSNVSGNIYVTGLYNGTAQIGSYPIVGYPGSYWADFMVFKINPLLPSPRLESEQENAFASFNIYPNPFTENFTLQTEMEISVSIYDMSGRLIEQIENVIGEIHYGEQLVKGMYLVVISDGIERKSFRIVKSI